MSPARDYESRIASLEKALYGNPSGVLSQSGGVTLREFIEEKIASVEKAVTLAVLNEQASRFVDKGTFRKEIDDTCADIKDVCDRLKVLEESKAELKGKASQSQTYIALFFGGAAFIMGIIGLFVK